LLEISVLLNSQDSITDHQVRQTQANPEKLASDNQTLAVMYHGRDRAHRFNTAKLPKRKNKRATWREEIRIQNYYTM
jgi:hypothetical protein